MKVWITRSQPGADRQAQALAAAGLEALVAPVLEIRPLSGSAPEGPFDIIIFLSEHAVLHGLPRLCVAGARVLAVGARTAAVLRAAGCDAVQPARADSEGLLALPLLRDVAGRRVLLVCGADGRMLLATELAARGAHLSRFVCYRRSACPVDPAALEAVDVIAAGSADGLTAAARLWFAAGGRVDVPVLVPSARVREQGVALGFSNVHDCAGADDQSLLRGLQAL
jgi:uroporphyrinogen-III synthase